MEKYHELNISSNNIINQIQEFKEDNNTKLKNLQNNILKKKLQHNNKICKIKENNYYLNFNTILENYFKLVYNFSPTNLNKVNVIKDNLNSLGQNVIEKLLDLSNIDIFIQKYVVDINNEINNLDNNLNYFLLQIYNFNDNIVNPLGFQNIKDYFAYL